MPNDLARCIGSTIREVMVRESMITKDALIAVIILATMTSEKVGLKYVIRFPMKKTVNAIRYKFFRSIFAVTDKRTGPEMAYTRAKTVISCQAA